VREAFFQISTVPATPTVLVFGGSQGAHAINQVVIESAGEMLARTSGLRIIHQTGDKDFTDAQAAYAKLGGMVEAHRFIDDMPAAFAKASLLICRSGASTVAEVTAAGRPAVFVPFPRAADDHQKRNAEALERAGAAVMLEEQKLTRESLVETVSSLLADALRLRTMGEAARKLSHPNAAHDIASMAAKLAGAAG
jgi:UDP-N-acetylglucosamine--N-acetylmuramyl-(pentapeptide) pyrophosphoryl-undecaprenol N-acetylglucosamine transferase